MITALKTAQPIKVVISNRRKDGTGQNKYIII